MILQLTDIKKYYGANEILSGVTATVSVDDRIAIIGENGAGKTTLLKIIAGDLQRDDGELFIARGLRVGYLSQHNDFAADSTIFTEMKTAFNTAREALSRMREIEALLIDRHDDPELIEEHDRAERIVLACDYYNADTRINKLLQGFGFSKHQYDLKTHNLSGGEATRLRLAKLLLGAPDILLLDEPTNHLDFATINFLEQELLDFKGAVISVTHDRAFIDNVCKTIWEVERGVLIEFKGRFENYFDEKLAIAEQQQKKRDAEIKTVKKLEEYIAKNKVRASTAKMAKSREKQLARITVTDKPIIAKNRFRFGFSVTSEPYKDILTCKDLFVSAGEKSLIEDAQLTLLRGEKLIIAGENGSGKSTFLKVLTKEEKAQGYIRFGLGVQTSIFRQHQQKRGGRVIDAIRALRPKFTEQEARDLLARFLFRGDDVFAECTTLSGGESSRLRLAEMTLEQSNFLMMDEPTNHLDLFTRESLTNALCAYEGTLLIVSHDRYLMAHLDCPILYIRNKSLVRYENYSQMIDSITDRAEQAETVQKERAEPNRSKEGRKKRAQARQRLRELEVEIERCESLIAELGGELVKPDVCTDHTRLTEITNKLEQTHIEHDSAFEEWESLMAENLDE